MDKRWIVAVLAAVPLGGCITVDPPDKPIDINLNVKIEQEVLVRLDQEVDALIADNPEAFPTEPEDVPDEPPGAGE
ncbi:YnbE family lipoprotein [Sphingomicrobium nitratireducens]|uniref:YnbE family lipoprotein n=1 Tax=Sphingomicrobium nitratireducens TaxID=2964666 RepID=UPI00223FC387|nr:YnbE family lipoprotein [Sphingomicrobium nitratireducens]